MVQFVLINYGQKKKGMFKIWSVIVWDITDHFHLKEIEHVLQFKDIRLFEHMTLCCFLILKCSEQLLNCHVYKIDERNLWVLHIGGKNW